MSSEIALSSEQTSGFIRGGVVSFDITNIPEAVGCLTEPGSERYFDFYNESTDTPGCIGTIQLSSWGESWPSGAKNIYGRVSFDTLAVESKKSWKKSLLKQLEDYFSGKFQINKINHDSEAMYIRLDQNYFLRTCVDSSPEECLVSVRLISVDNYYAASPDLDVIEIFDPETSDLSQVITNIVKIQANITDIINDLYGEGYENNPATIKLRTGEYEGEERSAEATEMAIGQQAVNEVEFEVSIIEEGLNAVGGCFAAKRALEEVADFYNAPEHEGVSLAEIYQLVTIFPLLHGDSGTGKSSLAEGLASLVKAEVEIIRGSDIAGSLIGESAKNIRKAVTDVIEKDQKTAIIIEDIDTIIGRQANTASHKEAKQALKTLLSQIAEFYPKVLFIATTSRNLSELDQDFFGNQLFSPIEVNRPTKLERVDIWTMLLQRKMRVAEILTDETKTFSPFAKNVTDYNLEDLASVTDQLTGRDIDNIIQKALRRCLRAHRNSGEPVTLTSEVLTEAAKEYVRTL